MKKFVELTEYHDGCPWFVDPHNVTGILEKPYGSSSSGWEKGPYCVVQCGSSEGGFQWVRGTAKEIITKLNNIEEMVS